MLVRALLVAAVCVASGGFRLSAQAQPAYALQGAVRDSTGGVIVGAAVSLSSGDASVRTTHTDAQGQFRFTALRGDRYTIAVSANGFAAVTDAIAVGDQPVTSFDVVLQVLVTEHIEVAAAVGGTASGGLTGTTLTGAALDVLPDDPGALLMRLRELAGATDTGAPVTILVDGFRQSLRLPPKQAIQAIRISSNWFAPEFAEPGQARIDVITKPGSSAVHGEVKINFNDESMNARNALALRRSSGQMRDGSGYLSGPVVPGRWSFTLYGGQWVQRHERIVNATVIDPNSLAPSVYAATVTAPARVTNVWLGTTYQLAPLHTLALSFERSTERADQLGLESGLDLPERAYRRESTDEAARVTLTSVLGRALNEFRAQVNPHRALVTAGSAAPAVTVFDAFSSGGNQSALFTATRHVDVEAAEAFTWFLPRHTIKTGIDARTTSRRYADRTNFGGTFVFGGDFERDANGSVLLDAAGARIPISPLENYRRTVAGLPGYAPSQFWITRGNPDVRFDTSWIGAFVQDDWTLRPRVSVSYGARWEWQEAAARPALGARAGIAVALDTARKHVVRLGAGTFYQRIEPELTLDVRRVDGRHQEQLLVDRPDFFPNVPSVLADATTSVSAIRVVEDDLRAPEYLIAAVSYEHQLSATSFLAVKYGFQRGTDLLRTRNINAPDASGGRVNPVLGPILQYESSGIHRRHDIGAGWRWTPGARASLFVNYGFVHGRSDTDGRMTTPADSMAPHEFGPTAADRPHQVTAGAAFRAPGAIAVSPYLTAASGRAFNITTGYDNNGDGVFTDRPSLVDSTTEGAIQTQYGSFLVDGSPGTIVTRNYGREPDAVRLDVRLSRIFRVSATSLALAVFIENAFNRAIFEGINGVVTSPSFGQPSRAAMPRRVTVTASVSF